MFPTLIRRVLALSVFWVLSATVAPMAQAFLPSSSWNLPIASATVYGEGVAAPNVPVGIDAWDPGNQWTIPYYTATTADPLRPLLYNANAWYKVYTGEWLRSGNSNEVEQAILASATARFPYPGNVYSSTSATQWLLPPSYNVTINPPVSPPLSFASMPR